MSAHSDDSHVGAELARQGLAFLHQARKVRDLDSGQVERIARHLLHKPDTRRRALLWPVLAAMAFVMVASAALAVAQGGLRALPVVGSLLFPTSASVPKQPESRGGHGSALPKTSGRDHKGAAPDPAASLQPSTPPAPARLPAVPLPAAPATVPEQAPATQPGKGPTEANGKQVRKVAVRDASASGPREHAAGAPALSEAAEESIVVESRSFATVIASWHRQHDAGIALGLLEAHEQRYPAGHLRLEAQILRAELQLAQGRNAQALSVLDGMSLSGIPRARELQTLRGELRAKADRCREARADLVLVLEKNMTDALAKRATRALAHCP
jgi:hypothetical protein